MRTLLVASIALTLIPSPASAATVSVHLTEEFRNTLSDLSFHADDGERNDVTVVPRDGGLVVTDTGAPVHAGENCESLGPHEAKCYPARSLGFGLGDGDDRIVLRGASAGVDGGTGDDVLVGGAGSDILRGGDGRDTIDAGPVTDQVVGDDTATFTDRLSGGDDADRFGNDDSLYYAAGPVPVTIDLAAGVAGEPGENDVIDGFEGARVAGDNGTVLGDERANSLGGHRVDGRGGDDRLSGVEIEGGAGDDLLSPAANGNADCGPGLDVVTNSTLAAAPAPLLQPSCELWRMFEGDFHQAFVRAPVAVDHRSAVVHFHCPDEEGEDGRCDGTLRLERPDQGDRVIGRARFRVKGRRTGKVAVPLGRSDLAAARRAGGLPVRVRVRVNHTTDPQDFSYLGAFRTTLGPPTGG